jgi:hypothetical protein
MATWEFPSRISLLDPVTMLCPPSLPYLLLNSGFSLNGFIFLALYPGWVNTVLAGEGTVCVRLSLNEHESFGSDTHVLCLYLLSQLRL